MLKFLVRFMPSMCAGISSWRLTRAKIKLAEAEAYDLEVKRFMKDANAIRIDCADDGLIDLKN